MFNSDNEDQVLGFTQWCLLNNISVRTGRRIIDGPDGPAVVKLSDRKLGITVRENRLWQQRRARAKAPVS
jgi:hypothetical protein